MMQQIWSIDRAQALALKDERLVRIRMASLNPYPLSSYRRSRNYSHRVEEKAIQPKGKQVVPKQTGVKSRTVLVIKCYKCGEEGHVSSNCLLRKFVNTTIHDGEDDKEYEYEEIEAQDVCEEEGEEVVCMTQRLLCSTPQPNNTQRKKNI
jgi:hypothetical protein